MPLYASASLTFGGRIANASFFPGEGRYNEKKTSGKSFPAGVIKGGCVFCTPHELFTIASLFNRGAGARLNSWNFLFAEGR